jgi:sorbitol-specific phosphotransferase system component IIC
MEITTDLQGTGILEVLAQLAVALVGFSALVGALRRVSDPRHHQLHQIRLSTIVLLPVIALVFSLAPYALANLSFPEPLGACSARRLQSRVLERSFAWSR